MSKQVHTMHYAANLGFGRLHCLKCDEETLHQHQKCVHCGTAYRVATPWDGSKFNPSLKQIHQVRSQAQERQRKKLSIAP